MNAKTWDEVINEGGEGYNPYTAPIEDEPAWSRVMDMYHRTCRIMDGTSSSDPQYVVLKARAETLKTTYQQFMAASKTNNRRRV